MSGARRARKSLLAFGAALALVAPVMVLPTVASAEPVGSLSKFMPLQPERILDTREGLGAPKRRVPAQGSVDLTVLGRDGIPTSGVSAVVLNVTITGASSTGFVQVFPTNRAQRGGFSTINHTPSNPTIAGLATAPIGDAGQVTIYTTAGGHLLADVFGYYTASDETSDGRFVALPPDRALDTRTGEGLPAPPNPGDQVNCTDFSTWSSSNDYFWRYYPHYGDVARLDRDDNQIPCEALPGAPSAPQRPSQPRPAAGATIDLQVTGVNGVPASGVAAVALNITATQSARAGFLQVVPTSGTTATGSSSNLNVNTAGQTMANVVIVPVGASGKVTIYTSHGAHILADVAGYYTDSSAPTATAGLFQAIVPERALDTRSGPKREADTELVTDLRANGEIFPATGVAAVALNIAVVGPERAGFLQVFPTGQAAGGSSSNVNFAAAQTVANAALTPLGDQNQVSLFISQRGHFLVDVSGYFISEGGTGATQPTNPVPPDVRLQGLRIAPHSTTVAYNRDEWVHWVDDDSDCQNTRAEVLWVESEITVQYDAAGCVVISGRWTDPYTGKVWTAASDLDVDHTVALQNAHLSGGHAWATARKQAYANDWMQPEHLNAIEDNLNASKGASAPDRWKPPLQSAWCLYAVAWTEIKKRWDLAVTQSEYDALEDMLATC